MTLYACPACVRCSVDGCPGIGACMDHPSERPCEHDQVRCEDHPCEACCETEWPEDAAERLLWAIFAGGET